MGANFRTLFSDGFNTDIIGRITGSADYVRFPNLPGSLFKLKAYSTNIGSFFIGTATGSSTQLAFEVDAGDDTDWFKMMGDNLNNLFYLNLSGSSEQLGYWLQK